MQKIVFVALVFIFGLTTWNYFFSEKVIACVGGFNCTSTCANCDVTCLCDDDNSYGNCGSISCGPNQFAACKDGEVNCYDEPPPKASVCIPNAIKVDCPTGYQKTTTLASQQCGGNTCSGLGTAQETGACCGMASEQKECTDWYQCGYKASTGEPKYCRDCTDPQPFCVRWNLDTYECVPICTAGTAPTSTSPANGAIVSAPSGSGSVQFSWTAPSSWGVEESGANRSYTVCLGTNSTNPCVNQTFSVGSGTNPTTTYTRNVQAGNKYWSVSANNTCGSTSVPSAVRNICIEGNTLPGDPAVGNAYYSAWGACNATTHKRTRTCAEDCGTDNCTAAAAAGLLEEDCIGEIRGTIFDATELSSCPSFDTNTGYLIGVDTALTANNRSFVMADQSNTAPHPWSLLTPAETDDEGNYSVRVYAPATYTYDFSDLNDMYVVGSGPKLTCTSTNAVVAGSPTNCGTQPCTLVNNMSFGFDRYYGGWWQVQGAGVHGETGIRSRIPLALPTEQSLILGEPTLSNRRGVASFGLAVDKMLGVNEAAKVSENLWQTETSYQGTIYDHGYFNQQFKKYTTTEWDGITSLTYDDNGRGYQIFKTVGNVTNFSYSPTGTEMPIFLIDGDVTINTNITVPNGAFLAILASGDITFGTGVTRADGWYLADNINVRCIDANSDSECDRTDVQFLGNGSFVGWEGINLSRDRGGDTNILGPSSKFTYRMDLYNNAPEPLKILTKRYKPYVP